MNQNIVDQLAGSSINESNDTCSHLELLKQGDPKEQELGHTKLWHDLISFPSFKRILVAYDGMQMSKRALGYAAYISKISNSEIVIVNVIERTSGLNSVLPVTIKANLESKEEPLLQYQDPYLNM